MATIQAQSIGSSLQPRVVGPLPILDRPGVFL
jgi:hypothetical protein